MLEWFVGLSARWFGASARPMAAIPIQDLPVLQGVLLPRLGRGG